jgi:8-oxo-dGTP diphosphatase
MRDAIKHEVDNILPFDAHEEQDKRDVIAWIGSGVELCRRQKPDTPPRHLVSYFVVIDAGLWLPPGGHVEPGEHPRTTVIREALEELF